VAVDLRLNGWQASWAASWSRRAIFRPELGTGSVAPWPPEARRRPLASRFRAPFQERKTPSERGAHRELDEVLCWGRRTTGGAHGARQGARLAARSRMAAAVARAWISRGEDGKHARGQC